MEPTIFKPRLKFKPPLKFFQFGHGSTWKLQPYFDIYISELKTSFSSFCVKGLSKGLDVILRANTCIFCVQTRVYFACKHVYILRVNTCIFCVQTRVYFACKHVYILRANTCIFCVQKRVYFGSP